MNKDKVNVPKVRFPGFTEPWEHRKLGELTKTNAFKQYVSDAFKEGKYEVIQQGDKPVAGYAEGQPFENYETVVLFGDHTLSLYKPKNPFLVASDGVKILSSSIEMDGWFYYYLLEKYKPQSEGYKRHFTILKECESNFPKNIEEQTKIGAYFSSLDHLITLHQRKLNHLRDKKKGLLQKMFPKNGESFPQLRFPGFTDPWEQRKVGEFLVESKVTGSDGSSAKKLTVKLWGKGVIPKEEVYKGSSSTNYYIRKAGQFIYGKLDFVNQAFGIIPEELDGYESTLDSPAFDISNKINSKYLLEYVSRKEFYHFQGTLANGSRKAKRIHVDTFFNMPITLPSLEEQNQIGTFLKTLDSLITLHQRKLEHLQQQKKGLLQQMFV